ncbi:hypothetical protein GCM10009678_68730 [Actinomadura kijaniata]
MWRRRAGNRVGHAVRAVPQKIRKEPGSGTVRGWEPETIILRAALPMSPPAASTFSRTSCTTI